MYQKYHIASIIAQKLFMNKLFFSTLLFFLLSVNASAQLLKAQKGIHVSWLNGYSFAPNKIDKTGESMDGFVSGFNLGIHKQVNGSKDWHRTIGNPRVGINIQTIFMNKPDTFGFHFSVLPFIQIRLKQWPNADIGGKIALGGAYVNKTFKRATNFDNRATAMPLNFALEVGLIYNHKISKQMDLNAELGYFHLSNGSFMMPNGGFNIYYLKSGLTYFIDYQPFDKRTSFKLDITNKNWYYTTYLAGGYREQGTFAYRRRFPIFAYHQAMMKPISKIYNLGFGFDVFYDATQRLIDEPLLKVSDVKESDKWNAALGFCNELTIGKLAVPLHFYHYFYDLNVVKQRYYLRFGLTYYPTKKIYFGCYFKGSVNKYKSLESDFMEFALGYKFKK